MSIPGRGYSVTPAMLNARAAAVRKDTVSSDAALKRIRNTATVGTTLSGTGSALTATTTASGVARRTGTALTTKGSPGVTRQAVGKFLTKAGKVTRFGGPKGFVIGTGLYLLGKALEGSAVKDYNNAVDNTTPDQKANVAFPPLDYEYNLPPHRWSLPIRPYTMDGTRESQNFAQNNHPGDFHRLRRGVIWHWDNGNYLARTDEKGVVTTAGEVRAEIDKKLDPKVQAKLAASKPNNYKYGFQFLWNPETISSSIARNMDVTPTSADRFRSVAGAFPGQETYQFQILLDRVNDFACLRAAYGDSYEGTARRNVSNYSNPNTRHIYGDIPPEYLDYYKHGLGSLSTQKLADLAKYGTMADLEYLFKALNGDGANQDGGGWATLLKKKTANIGFLSPSLMAFRFGPNAQQHLSFVGWITNLSINHTYFTEDMIPLRTTVSFSCDAFAGSTVI